MEGYGSLNNHMEPIEVITKKAFVRPKHLIWNGWARLGQVKLGGLGQVRLDGLGQVRLDGLGQVRLGRLGQVRLGYVDSVRMDTHIDRHTD